MRYQSPLRCLFFVLLLMANRLRQPFRFSYMIYFSLIRNRDGFSNADFRGGGTGQAQFETFGEGGRGGWEVKDGGCRNSAKQTATSTPEVRYVGSPGKSGPKCIGDGVETPFSDGGPGEGYFVFCLMGISNLSHAH